MQNIQLNEMRTPIHVSIMRGDNNDFCHRESVPLQANEVEVLTQGKLLQHRYTFKILCKMIKLKSISILSYFL